MGLSGRVKIIFQRKKYDITYVEGKIAAALKGLNLGSSSSFPTDPFTILEPQNPEKGEL